MTNIPSLVMVILIGLVTSGQPRNNPDLFTVQFVCDSPELYRIDYVADLDGEYLCQGGIANFDKVPLNNDPNLFVHFSKEDMEGQAEGELTLELHLYGENEDKEMAVTLPVKTQARLGTKRVIQITGSRSAGYTAALAG